MINAIRVVLILIFFILGLIYLIYFVYGATTTPFPRNVHITTVDGIWYLKWDPLTGAEYIIGLNINGVYERINTKHPYTAIYPACKGLYLEYSIVAIQANAQPSFSVSGSLTL